MNFDMEIMMSTCLNDYRGKHSIKLRWPRMLQEVEGLFANSRAIRPGAVTLEEAIFEFLVAQSVAHE